MMFPAFLSRPVRRVSASLLVMACGLVVAATPARAWNPAGHMTTASFAYDQLSPALRARVLEILQAHPDFARWQDAAPKEAPGFDPGRYAFMHASAWPDEIRRSGSPYDHPVWHYVDFPLVPPGFPLEEPPGGVEDILTASASCERMLADAATPAMDRAVALSWLAHLVGDVMQPLHGATMISAAHPKPGGDRGGNLFFVDLGGNSLNLHAYWDRLGGTGRSLPEFMARAVSLKKAFPRAALPELDTARDMRGWALESRQLALDVVYRRGTLPGASEPDAAPPALPGDYEAAAHRLAERRLTLAGYRLADELTRLKP